MFLTKWRPNTALESFFDSDFFPSFAAWQEEDKNSEVYRLPKTNISETDKEYVLTIEMPGFEKSDIDVSLENDQLVVTGERQEETEANEKQRLIRREIQSTKFRRSFRLGQSVDRDKIKAKVSNGVLTLTVPKRPEVVGRKISID